LAKTANAPVYKQGRERRTKMKYQNKHYSTNQVAIATGFSARHVRSLFQKDVKGAKKTSKGWRIEEFDLIHFLKKMDLYNDIYPYVPAAPNILKEVMSLRMFERGRWQLVKLTELIDMLKLSEEKASIFFKGAYQEYPYQRSSIKISLEDALVVTLHEHSESIDWIMAATEYSNLWDELPVIIYKADIEKEVNVSEQFEIMKKGVLYDSPTGRFKKYQRRIISHILRVLPFYIDPSWEKETCNG
jgi:hypothetical protein